MITLKEIIKNRGATVNSRGEGVILKSGYQVSKRDLGRIDIAGATQQMVEDIVAYGLKRGEYAGFWIEDGYLYADISVRMPTKAKAMEMGKRNNQISILKWADMSCIYM